jgi:AcrR family transcriptional regulator
MKTTKTMTKANTIKRPATAAKPDRRQNILLSAEKLFAKYGFHAVSIRDIADDAGVPLALVGYHFGSKQQLYHAIFEHWGTMIEERLASLRRVMEGAGGGDRLVQLVDAFIAPVIRLRASPEGEFYALLMTRGLTLQSDEEDQIIREFFDPLAKAFIEAFHATLVTEFPGITQPQVAWAYQFALGALLHHISDARVHRLSGGENRPSDPAVMPQLVAFIAAGMRGAMQQVQPARTAASRKKK